MTQEFEKLFKELKHARLTESEKLLMRNNLEFFAAEYPARPPFRVKCADALSALSVRLGGSGIYNGSPFAVAFALVLVIGVGTSYAASDALPGDVLYPVKVSLNESVESALAITVESQAKLHSEKVVRRLEEAETLAAAGRLTPAARAAIETHINQNSNKFDEAVAKLAKADEEAKVAEVQSDLEAALIGHVEVLATLSTSLPESRPTIAKILATAQTRADISQNARANAEGALAVRTDDSVRELAIEKKREASKVADKVRRARAFASQPPAAATMSLMMDTGVVAEGSPQDDLEEGEQKFDAGEYGGALNSFQAVIRAAKTLDVQADAEVRLNTSITASTTNAVAAATSTATTTTETEQDN